MRCADAFPDDMYKQMWDFERKECTSVACSDRYDGNPYVCTHCRPSDHIYQADGTCVTCPEWLPNLDTEQRKCIPTCPDEAPYFDENKNKCMSCAEYSYDDVRDFIYFSDGYCESECSADTPVSD